MENILLKLNEMLVSDEFDQERFSIILKTIKEQFNLTFKLLDFEYYNEERLTLTRKEKTAFIQSKSYEMAARKRDIEKECEKHIEYKTKNKLEKSMFYADSKKLWYLFLGTSKNDKEAKELFMKLITK